MEQKYFVRVQIIDNNTDEIIGWGSAQLSDLDPKLIAEAARVAGQYAEGPRLAEYDKARRKVREWNRQHPFEGLE